MQGKRVFIIQTRQGRALDIHLFTPVISASLSAASVASLLDTALAEPSKREQVVCIYITVSDNWAEAM
ncbi:hypothetical protein D9758_012305 [Tetrapyrgos nigripes]|uniref:Uncharacterized protein n=1 Tax=Tetrapyrgos nigripes TaxID=182062 RepID=A0A8H5CI11_9AGAR|nr:hypothetical protein D9758_012305 [Tetrapyrgos nigripes]